MNFEVEGEFITSFFRDKLWTQNEPLEEVIKSMINTLKCNREVAIAILEYRKKLTGTNILSLVDDDKNETKSITVLIEKQREKIFSLELELDRNTYPTKYLDIFNPSINQLYHKYYNKVSESFNITNHPFLFSDEEGKEKAISIANVIDMIQEDKYFTSGLDNPCFLLISDMDLLVKIFEKIPENNRDVSIALTAYYNKLFEGSVKDLLTMKEILTLPQDLLFIYDRNFYLARNDVFPGIKYPKVIQERSNSLIELDKKLELNSKNIRYSNMKLDVKDRFEDKIKYGGEKILDRNEYERGEGLIGALSLDGIFYNVPFGGHSHFALKYIEFQHENNKEIEEFVFLGMGYMTAKCLTQKQNDFLEEHYDLLDNIQRKKYDEMKEEGLI